MGPDEDDPNAMPSTEEQASPWAWVPAHWDQPQQGYGLNSDSSNPATPPPQGFSESPPAQGDGPINPALPPKEASGSSNLTPEEEAQIQIDAPPSDSSAQKSARLSPEEESQIEIDGPPPGMPLDGPVVSPNQVDNAGPVTMPSEVDDSLHAPPPEERLPETQPASGQAVTSPNQIDPNLAKDEQARVNAMDPLQYAQYRAEKDAERQRFAAGEKAKADAKLLEDQHAELVYRQQAAQQAAADRAQRNADAKRIEATIIDPDRWSKNQSVGQTIISLIAAAIGGAMSQYTGGRNLALEQINKAIDNDIAAQKENITNQWRSLDQRRSDSQDAYGEANANANAMATYRQAAYQAAISGIDTKLQDFDPNSSTAMRLRDTRDQIVRQMTTAQAAQDQQNFKNGVEQRKSIADFAKAQAETEKLRLESAKLRGQLGGPKKPDTVVGTFTTLDDVPVKEREKAFRLPTKNGIPGGWVISNSPESAKEATHYVGMYNQIDHDLNEMQRLSVERDGAKSAGGTLWSKWQTNGEQHYRQLLTDAANTYGMLIHGRAPTSGVLEEVLKDMPELKSAWERGDTTTLINDFRNDVDNRASLRLQDWGANHKVTSDRYKPPEINANTLVAPLRAEPVKGAGGYASIDAGNANQQLDALAQHYQQNPTLGGNKALTGEFDRIDEAQHSAVAKISGDIAKLKAVKKRSAQQEAELHQDSKALADRLQVIDALKAARERHSDVMGEGRAAERKRIDDQVNSENPAQKRFGI